MNKLIFLNKVVLFCIQNDILVMFSPRFETIANKTFVVGTIPPKVTTNEWAKDKQCSLSWQDVESYIIFDSIEEYVEFDVLQSSNKEE